MTELEAQDSFRQELLELLAKYKAELTATDLFIGAPGTGQDIRMTAYIQYLDDDNELQTEVGLTSRITAN